MINKVIKGIALLITLLLVVYIAFLKWPRASVNSKDVTAELSAVELYEAFTDDEKQAQAKYLGKVIVVSGVIDDIYEDETDAPVLILKSKEGNPVTLVTLVAGQAGKLKEYKRNDEIRIKAQCSGLLMEVTLGKGIIME